MLEYISHIIFPYVKSGWEHVGEDSAAIVIINNFKGQVTDSVLSLLESNNIHICLLPPNTTDALQPMDVAVNKPAKGFIRRRFEEWYSDEVMKHLNGKDMDDLLAAEIQLIHLSMQVVKQIGAKWLVDMAEYTSDNPQFIMNGFIRSGITGALDGVAHDDGADDLSNDSESETDSEMDISSDEDITSNDADN